MAERILEFLKKYSVFQFILIGLLLLGIHKSIGSNNFIYLLFINTLVVIWLGGYVLYILQKVYREKTGRDYIKDRLVYKMSFIELYRFFKDADNQSLDMKQFHIEDWKRAEGILFGYGDKGELVKISSQAEANIFVTGAPGSYKTSGIVLPNCGSYQGAILAVDTKGDIYNYAKKKRGKVLRFCPDLRDSDGNNIALEHSCTFDPLSDVWKMSSSDRKLFITNMSITLIPTFNEKDTYFSTNARKLFCGFVLFLIETCKGITFPEIIHTILHNQMPRTYSLEWFPENIFQWIELIASSPYPAAKEQVASMIGNNEKNISGVYDRLCTPLTLLTNDTLDQLLVNSDNCISADMLEEGYDVFLQINHDNLDVYGSLFTMIIQNFMTSFSRRIDTAFGSHNRPILIILDEFPQLTFSYDTINSALSTLRSKSVQCMIITQNISQLAERYGNFGYQSLLGNCIYQLCLKANDDLTQHHFSALCGKKRRLIKSFSQRDASVEVEVPVYRPEEFGDLQDELVLYYDGKHAIIKKIKPYE